MVPHFDSSLLKHYTTFIIILYLLAESYGIAFHLVADLLHLGYGNLESTFHN